MLDLIKKLLFILPSSDKWKLAGLLTLMIIGSALDVLGVGMIPVFISIVANPQRVLEVEFLQPVFEYFSVESGRDLLVMGGIVLIIVFAVKNAYLVAFHYVKARFLYNRGAIIANRLFRGYMNAPYTFLLSRNSSEILRNVTQEGNMVVGHVLGPILKLVMDVLLILLVVPLLFVVNPMITLVAIGIFLVAAGGFLKLIRGKIQTFGWRAQKQRKVMIQAVNEGVGGMKDIRVLQRTNWFARRFQRSVIRYANAQIFRDITRHMTKPMLETVAVASMLGIALFLFWQGQSVDMVITILALFGAAAIRLMPTMKEIVDAVNSLRYYSNSVNVIYNEIQRLESMPQAVKNDIGVRAPTLKREVRFENVSFAYPDSNFAAIKDLSLVIPKGKAVAFIGPSGAGKTTVVDLLLGLLEPQQGRITMDGIDIGEDIEGWRQNVGYIPQFIFLSDDTLRRNIAFGLPEKAIDEERLWKAIRSAQLMDLVDNLPDGIETVIGERGVRLSGGQRQRIGIARALYENPSVLIMDEATSALDHETERCVIESIERLKGERTIIMIAHRLSTVRNCDCLYMLEEGRVKDSGRFTELSGRNAELCVEAVR